MGGTFNERVPSVTTVHIGSRLSTMNAVLPGVYFRKRSRIKNVWFVDQAGIAKDNTQHATLILQDGSAASYATLDTSAVAAVANTPLAMTYTASAGSDANSPELDVPAGTMLNINIVNHGTAIQTDAVLLIEWYPL